MSSDTTYSSNTHRKYLKMMYPSLLKFDLYIKLSKRSHVESFYKNVTEIILNNELNSLTKDEFGIIGEKKYRKRDKVHRLLCTKFDITIEYSGFNPYVKTKGTSYYKKCRGSAFVKLCNINPSNLKFSKYRELSWLSGISSYEKPNKHAYKNLTKLLEHIGIDPSEIFTDDGSLILGNAMIRNIVFSQCISVYTYPKFYIGYNRAIGISNGCIHENMTYEEDSIWKTEFRLDTTGSENNSFHKTVGLYLASDYVYSYIKDNILRNFGDIAKRSYMDIFKSNELKIENGLKNVLVMQVRLDFIYDIISYKTRPKDDDYSTKSANEAMFSDISFGWVKSVLAGNYSAYNILMDYGSRVFMSPSTTIWDNRTSGNMKWEGKRKTICISSKDMMNTYCFDIYKDFDIDKAPITSYINNPSNIPSEDLGILKGVND